MKKIFQYHISKYGSWFRLFGYGIHVKSAVGHIPLFSERNGYVKAFYLFNIRIAILKPLNKH